MKKSLTLFLCATSATLLILLGALFFPPQKGMAQYFKGPTFPTSVNKKVVDSVNRYINRSIAEIREDRWDRVSDSIKIETLLYEKQKLSESNRLWKAKAKANAQPKYIIRKAAAPDPDTVLIVIEALPIRDTIVKSRNIFGKVTYKPLHQ